MAYQVTARKWRPQRFEDVVGQEHITATLKNALKTKRIAHAFLFTGPRGIGKTTTARILAKALNCENPIDFEPCNECSMCKTINDSQSMDIFEIDGASNRGIDEIRTLRESVKYPPTRGKFKVYIIDEVHMLTKESFNAFLKTLEEPPSHTIFIFATTDIHKVPLTIISRCQRFDFRRIQLDVIKKQLKKIADEEKITIDDKTLTLISKKADGALRDAQSLFDQVVSFCGNKIDPETVSKMLNLIDDELFFEISDAVLNKDFPVVFDTTDKIYQNGWDFIDFTDGLLEHFRNILSVVLTQRTDLIETAEIYREKYSDYKNSFSKGDLLRILNYLSKLQQELRYSNNQKLKIEIALTNLIGLEKSSTLSDIISGIESGNLDLRVEEKPFIARDDSHNKYQAKSNPPDKKKESKTDNTREQKNVSNSYLGLTKSSISGELNFEMITQRWKDYIADICVEKSFLLTPLFINSKPTMFDGVNLYVSIPDETTQSSLSLHKDYIDKKSRSFFGKKISINFDTSNSSTNKKSSESKEKTIDSTKIDKNVDLYEKIIKDDLGGQEITN
jgi:DNA polymerase III subunit gamma/tau